jgi:NAD(P)-dependent dehydrogenase (short-subunit alcohol dehydrogenase family)
MAHHPSLVPSYALAKLALNGLTVKMAAALLPYKIDVNAVDPGFVATYPGTKEMGAIDPAVAVEDIFWVTNLPAGTTGNLYKNRKQTGW